MNTADDTPGITYQANLPLRWRVEPAPTAAVLAGQRYANIALLRSLATLEATLVERELDGDSQLAKALDRVESKLDIVLSMLARLSMRETEFPHTLPITLGARQIQWQSDEAMPSVETYVLLYLYLSPRLPEPLQLHAKITASANGICQAELLDRDPEFEEWMTRTLFRYHRRGLQARHQA